MKKKHDYECFDAGPSVHEERYSYGSTMVADPSGVSLALLAAIAPLWSEDAAPEADQPAVVNEATAGEALNQYQQEIELLKQGVMQLPSITMIKVWLLSCQ